MNKYSLVLSMGHDTSLRDRFYDVEAESEFIALENAWSKMQEEYPEQIKEAFKKKGLVYRPYFMVLSKKLV